MSKLSAIYDKYIASRFWKEDIEIFRATNQQEASGEIAQTYESLGVQKVHFVTAGSQMYIGGKLIVVENPTLYCKQATDIKVNDRVKIGNENYRVLFVNLHYKMKKEVVLVNADGENFGEEISQ